MFRRKYRGAAGQQYAIIVGLVAVVALGAVAALGGGVRNLMARTSNTLGVVVSEADRGGGGGGDCTATRASCLAHFQAGCTADGNYSVSGIGTASCNMTVAGGGWTRCFNFTNTSAIDLSETNAWFDTCVDMAGASWSSDNRVMMRVLNTGGSQVYAASGSQTGTWTYNNVTSTNSDLGVHHDAANHDRKITLDNGHFLQIAGRGSANGGCGGDHGSGYTLVVRSTAGGTYHASIRLIVASYRRPSSPGTTRSFNSWAQSSEISLSNSDFNTCSEAAPSQLGSFEFYVR